jgi:hypothetical protein
MRLRAGRPMSPLLITASETIHATDCAQRLPTAFTRPTGSRRTWQRSLRELECRVCWGRAAQHPRSPSEDAAPAGWVVGPARATGRRRARAAPPLPSAAYRPPREIAGRTALRTARPRAGRLSGSREEGRLKELGRRLSGSTVTDSYGGSFQPSPTCRSPSQGPPGALVPFDLHGAVPAGDLGVTEDDVVVALPAHRRLPVDERVHRACVRAVQWEEDEGGPDSAAVTS